MLSSEWLVADRTRVAVSLALSAGTNGGRRKRDEGSGADAGGRCSRKGEDDDGGTSTDRRRIGCCRRCCGTSRRRGDGAIGVVAGAVLWLFEGVVSGEFL